MRTTLLILLSLFGFAASAQAPFHKVFYDQDTLFWSSHFVIEAVNGDVVEVGQLSGSPPGTKSLVFRRLDPDGTLISATRLFPPTSTSFVMYAGLELPNGSFLLFGTDFPQAAVVHLDAQGILLSVRHRNSSSGYYRSAFWENDSTILALGSDNFEGLRHLLLSRFNSDGAYLGSVGYSIDAHGADGIMGINCAAGGVLIAAEGVDTLNGSPATPRTSLLRLDDAGNVLWAKRYSRPGQLFYPAGIVENDDGTLLVGGSTTSTGGQKQCSVMLLDEQGETLSTRVLHNVQDPNAGFFVRGFMADTDTSAMFAGYLQQGTFMLSCDRAGTPFNAARFTSNQTLDRPVRSMFGDLLIPVAGETPNGVFAGVALGVWRSTDPFSFSCSEPITMATTTLDPLIGQGHAGQPIPLLFDDITAQCVQTTSVLSAYDPCLGAFVAPLPGQVAEARLWPVPANDRVTVSGNSMQRIDILDTSGRLVLTTPANGSPTMEVNIARLSAGPYHMRITAGTAVHVLRMVKE
jgi:hypothetical protein